MKKLFSAALLAAVAVLFSGAGPIAALAVTGYTAAQVAPHNSVSDCWLIISGQVYNVTNFIPIHPGGNAIVPFCGTDATTIFSQIHDQAAVNLLPSYLIGKLITALTAPTNLAAVPAQTSVALTWTVSGGGIAPLTYFVMRNGAAVGTTTLASFTDAGLTASTSYSYIIKVSDSATPAANTASTAALSITTLPIAAPGPLTAPGNLASVPAQTSVALSWTASTGGVAPIVYSVIRNGTTVGTTSLVSFVDPGLTAQTTYSYAVLATDSATPTPNTASSAALSITTLSTAPLPDTTKPTVSITAPANKAKVSGIVTITVNAADNVGVTQVSLFIDGKQISTSTSSPFSFTWDTSKVTGRKHTIRVKASDAAGNTAISKAINVKVANTTSQHHGDDDKNENEHENEHGQTGNGQGQKQEDD